MPLKSIVCLDPCYYPQHSTVTQDIGQVGTVKEKAIEIVGKHISEQGMADRLRIFSVEKS